MPNRILKARLRQSERWNKCSEPAQNLYVRLLMLVDDFGRYEAHPTLLASEGYPYGDPEGHPMPVETVTNRLQELTAHDLLFLYQVEGKPYLELTRWQERTRRANSFFPAPNPTDTRQTPGEHQADTRQTPGEHQADTRQTPGRHQADTRQTPGSRAALTPSPSPSPTPTPTPSPSPTPTPTPTPTPSPAPAPAPATVAELVSSVVKRIAEKTKDTHADIKNLLCIAYNRPEDQSWSYVEEATLAEIARRPKALAEVKLLLDFRRKLSQPDRKYFPQSILSLLQKWDEKLDASRGLQPRPIKSSRPFAPPPNSRKFIPSENLGRQFRNQIQTIMAEPGKAK
jgi:hypothetical protein